jgi:NAD(P)-dependent dehydrogenase (short-subunit alcohol dehydrogenase family)
MRTAIVTGGAKGIGKAIVDRFINEGYFVYLIDMDRSEGEKFAASLKDCIQYIPLNIADEEGVKTFFSTLQNQQVFIDVLVNNAGIIRDNVIWKMPSEDFDAVIEVNLKGTWLMCKYASEILKTQKSGRIINISSRAWLGNPGQSNYSASKAGIVGLTRVLALELGRYGVYVNAIAPGLIDTPLTQKLPDDVLEKLTNAQPTKTIGKPEDIANAVSFLANEKTHFITGQTIYVDGGKSIGAGI